MGAEASGGASPHPRCVAGADGETRTLTDDALNVVPLPIGLRRRPVTAHVRVEPIDGSAVIESGGGKGNACSALLRALLADMTGPAVLDRARRPVGPTRRTSLARIWSTRSAKTSARTMVSGPERFKVLTAGWDTAFPQSRPPFLLGGPPGSRTQHLGIKSPSRYGEPAFPAERIDRTRSGVTLPAPPGTRFPGRTPPHGAAAHLSSAAITGTINRGPSKPIQSGSSSTRSNRRCSGSAASRRVIDPEPKPLCAALATR